MTHSFALVEDDPDQRDRLTSILTQGGERCTAFPDSLSFLKGLHRDTFDLACFDWNLPDISGVDLVRRVRDGTHAPALPIIMVTSRDEAEDIVNGLAAGADDYVTKPVVGGVLRARVTALLRRTAPATEAGPEIFGDVTFDSTRYAVRRGDDEQILTSKEYTLALLLFRNLHRPLARAYLMEEVWGRGANISSRTLDTHIYRLKNKLDLTPMRGFHLGPVYGYGYRLERGEAGATAEEAS